MVKINRVGLAGFMCAAMVAAGMLAAQGQAFADGRGSAATSGPGQLNVVVIQTSGTGLSVSSVRGRLESTPPSTVCGVKFRLTGTTIAGRPYESTAAAQCGVWPYADFTLSSAKEWQDGSQMCINDYWDGQWHHEYACVTIHR